MKNIQNVNRYLKASNTLHLTNEIKEKYCCHLVFAFEIDISFAKSIRATISTAFRYHIITSRDKLWFTAVRMTLGVKNSYPNKNN
jgi:hypothetical protein